jgi:hypothetical protein
MASWAAKPIEQVKAGDNVLSRDIATGKVRSRKVRSTSVRHVALTVPLTFSTGEMIECTARHPFHVEGVGFTPAGQLGIGTSIVTRAGPAVQVTKVERHDKPATVYNFTVEDSHTYVVGSRNSGLWVHNICKPDWVNNERTFMSWMQNLERERPDLGAEEIDEVIAHGRSFGVEPYAGLNDLAGHPGTNWPNPHIHFGNTRIHVGVPDGYTIPPLP